jgi:hypothetical protein
MDEPTETKLASKGPAAVPCVVTLFVTVTALPAEFETRIFTS